MFVLYYFYRQHRVQSEGDFEVFRPTGATRCTDRGEIWCGGLDGPLILARFYPIGAGRHYRTQKTENYTKFWNTCMNAPHGHIPSTIFMKFVQVDHSKSHPTDDKSLKVSILNFFNPSP